MMTDPQEPHRQHDKEQPRQHPPGVERDPLTPVATTDVPDAVEAASVERDATETTKDKIQNHRARGVDWVRPTDLLARSAASLSGRGIELQTKLAQTVDRGIVTGAKHLAAYAKKLPHVSSFGRGRTHEPPTRSAVGRS